MDDPVSGRRWVSADAPRRSGAGKVFKVPFRFSQVTVHPQVWGDVFSLSDFDVPVWDDLRLDALAALPHVGSAVGLAAASLETFIAHILDALATRQKVSLHSVAMDQ